MSMPITASTKTFTGEQVSCRGNSLPQQTICYEGEVLDRLLTSIKREIATARKSDIVLPEKIWYKVILVASDCNPRLLTKHLESLADSKKVPVVFVKDKKRGSLRLGELIKLKTAIAIGIKDKGNQFNQFISTEMLS